MFVNNLYIIVRFLRKPNKFEKKEDKKPIQTAKTSQPRITIQPGRFGLSFSETVVNSLAHNFRQNRLKPNSE
ncbi:hypothetical protein Hanom_Chr16g01469661 [Helianthus anomalus]